MSRSPAPRRRAALAAALALVALAAAVARDATARFLIVDDPPGPCDAVVVMAGDPDYERTAAAVALMRRENIATLILTGGEPGPGDSAESLRARAIALGVPETRIHIETVSHSTHEAVLAVAPILQSIGARTATVVTSPYHQRRATAAARRAWPGVVVRARAAAPSAWRPERWWATAGGRRVVVSEYAKLLYYGMRGWL
ncbi:MAG TPA: YdcF family protein [Vicinamibacteria bacterium]|nr:YdcF family protein [Vicinamibacteria bacterium]